MKAMNINAITKKTILVENDCFQTICYVFDEDGGIPNHRFNGVAAVYIASGTIYIHFVNGKSYILTEGDILSFDATIDHYVLAKEASKAILTLAK